MAQLKGLASYRVGRFRVLRVERSETRALGPLIGVALATLRKGDFPFEGKALADAWPGSKRSSCSEFGNITLRNRESEGIAES